jgi:hypothetical protein
MTKTEALRILELLPQLLLADIVTLETLVKAGEYKEARRLARKMKRGSLFG